MPIETLDLDRWVDRIKAEAPEFQEVARAADQLEVIDRAQAPRDSAAWVLEPSFQGGTSPNAAGRITQAVTYEVGVILAVRRFGDRTGGKASAKAREYRSALWRALVGWQPDPLAMAVELARGAPIRYTDQTIYLLDFFRFSTRITSP